MNILYHYTTVEKLKSILSSGKIALSLAHLDISERALNKNKLYFLSTTRTRANWYLDDRLTALIELNGTKLKQKYQTFPINYWEDITMSESEERIVSDTPYIPLKPYTASLHIVVPKSKSLLRKVLLDAKRLRIKIYMYNTYDDMASMRPHRRVSLKDLDATENLGNSDRLKRTGTHVSKHTESKLRPWLTLLTVATQGRMKQVEKSKDPATLALLARIKEAPKESAMVLVKLFDEFDRAQSQAYTYGPTTTEYKYANRIASIIRQKRIDPTKIVKYIWQATQS